MAGSSDFLLYGANGFVGEVIARLAAERGLRPLLAGRNAAAVGALAAELGLERRAFSLDDAAALDEALGGVAAVLHCAGPYLATSRPMVDACLRTGTHYLDLTGEIPVFEALVARDAEAKRRGVMILPAVGFDVVPTDCLAAHLQQRLPSATRLTLAFHSQGPAGLPPGTLNTIVELIPYGNKVRSDGRLEQAPKTEKWRLVDFGRGPIRVSMLTWGDLFMAYYSTGIPNIEVYTVIPAEMRPMLKAFSYLRPLFSRPAVQKHLKRLFQARATSPTPELRAQTHTSVWGQVEGNQGQTATARLHGPEAGVDWTSMTAVAAVEKVLAGNAPPGFQTPALAYGPDFVLEMEGVTREELD